MIVSSDDRLSQKFAGDRAECLCCKLSIQVQTQESTKNCKTMQNGRVKDLWAHSLENWGLAPFSWTALLCLAVEHATPPKRLCPSREGGWLPVPSFP